MPNFKKIKGTCLCGDVQFETDLPNHLDACHCATCQRWCGGPLVAADFRAGITLIKETGLVWYDSSKWAKRGFCKTCGSNLFYRLKGNDKFWSVAAGTLDLPAGLNLSKELFIEDKPDYYSFSGEHPRLTGPEAFASFTAEQTDD